MWLLIQMVVTLLLPGYVITLLIYNQKEISVGERILLAFGLSVILIPLLSFVTFSFRLLPPGNRSVMAVSLGLTLFALLLVVIKSRLKRT